MNRYQPFKPKYLYKGMTLNEYCIQNNLSYYSVISFVKRKLKKGSNKSIDDLIDEGIKTINRYGIVYYYNGIPLIEYAAKNGLNASSIRYSILRKKVKSNKPIQEIVNECVESYQKFSVKYYYNGMSLFEYCNSIGLNYSTVISRYFSKYADNEKIDTNEAIKQIVDYYIENPPINTKYFFNNQSLMKFCDSNGYAYTAIYRRIKTLESRYSLDSDQLVVSAIKKYEDKLKIENINNIFIKLEKGKIKNDNEIKSICDYLKIDFENLKDLMNMNFSLVQAINMIWYFYDTKTDKNYKIITDKKINNIFLLINNLQSSNTNIEKIDLYDLIGIYKSNLYDSRNEIILKEKKYITKIIFSLCRTYEIGINKELYEDFESEIKYYFFIVLDRIRLNEIGQIIKYIDLSVKGYFREYLKKYKKQNKELILNDVKYSNDNESKKTMLDYIADPNDIYINFDNSEFSDNMLEILSTLSDDDLLFITLKYQENYSDEDLSNHFNLALDEIKQKEIEILSLLKNNDGVKVLRKTRNDN